MISKEEYLKALDICLRFQVQFSKEVKVERSNYDLDGLERGDKIICESSFSKWFTVEKEYIIERVNRTFYGDETLRTVHLMVKNDSNKMYWVRNNKYNRKFKQDYKQLK